MDNSPYDIDSIEFDGSFNPSKWKSKSKFSNHTYRVLEVHSESDDPLKKVTIENEEQTQYEASCVALQPPSDALYADLIADFEFAKQLQKQTGNKVKTYVDMCI